MSEFNINEDAQSGEFSGSQSSSFNGESNASQPIESAFPDEDEETITMLDVIEREDELEEEASAVLGNSDEKNCTYPKGYISRQALYSCATCSDGTDDQVAAICLACSLECHDNHEVYELYTKRNYRCDCGNSKFKKGFECKLMDGSQKKSSLNENNKYNHNFSGRYCICDKRYPPDETDDSAESNDAMWQCIVCEDWYHTKHLGLKELPTKFAELICGQCVDKLDFVRYYKNLDDLEETKPPVTSANTAEHTKVESVESTVEKPDQKVESDSSHNETNSSPVTVSSDSVECKKNTICESDTNDSQAENKDPGHETSDQSEKSGCILEQLKEDCLKRSKISEASKFESPEGPLFWSKCEWRSKLCRCQKCMDMYKVKDCEYLLDEKDTVQYYEAQGKAMAKNSETPLERGMSALNRMNRTAVAEALHGYAELKADLSDYLRKFADTKKVVREEDIHEFFQQLKSKKRPRLDFSEH